MKTLNIHIYPSPMTHESRIMKETKAIGELKIVDKVIAVGIWEKGLPITEEVTEQVQIKRIKSFFPEFKKNTLSRIILTIEWMIKVFFYFVFKKVKIINAHNLAVLPLSVLLKLFNRKAILVYDAHELETERNGWRNTTKRIAKVVERLLIKFVDELIVVSPEIENWYKTKYNLKNVTTVLNTPPYKNINKQDIFRDKFNIKDDSLIFLYQGLLTPGRGIELILKTFSDLFKEFGNKYVVVFLGNGHLSEDILKYKEKNKNIFHHQAVTQDVLLNYTSSADIAFSLIENTCLSYYYCLPNKLFEYTMAGVPVIVTNLFEMEKLVTKHKIGYVIDKFDGNSLSKLITQTSKIEINQFKSNLNIFKEKYNWNNEEKKLIDIYTKIFN